MNIFSRKLEIHTTNEVQDFVVVGSECSPLTGVLLGRGSRLIFKLLGVESLALHCSESLSLLDLVNASALTGAPVAFRGPRHRIGWESEKPQILIGRKVKETLILIENRERESVRLEMMRFEFPLKKGKNNFDGFETLNAALLFPLVCSLNNSRFSLWGFERFECLIMNLAGYEFCI